MKESQKREEGVKEGQEKSKKVQQVREGPIRSRKDRGQEAQERSKDVRGGQGTPENVKEGPEMGR